MRTLARQIRRLLRDPIWIAVIAAAVIGVVLGILAARETSDELTEAMLGSAWRKNAADTRTFLTTLFGLQLTVLSIVLSFNAPMIQAAANQYSARLVPYYLKHVPLRRVLPMFALSSTYLLAGVREVGLSGEEGVRPRVVLSGAIVLAVVSFVLLTIAMIRTYRFMRVERVLELVREATFAAIARRARRTARLRLAHTVPVALAADASALLAPRSGYLVEVDVRGLTRIARRAGVRVRIVRTVGDYFDEGEVVGWIGRDGGGAVGERLARRLAGTLLIAPTREADLDPAYGIIILADVAGRALSVASNDAYTARQALQQIRSVLRTLARQPLGDWNVVDEDGSIRVSVMATQLRELISVAVEAPLRLGAGEPEVLDGVLEIALEVGLVAPDAEGRTAAHQLINRVLEDAMEYGDLRNGRLKRLLVEADLVRASLKEDSPRWDRHARSDWALTAADETH
jgi:uncharacterized membrane protein